jgi:hypothetical protein
MARPIDDDCRPVAGRAEIDQNAVKAVGDLLMLGVLLERRTRGFSERLGSFDRSRILRRS